MSENVKPNAFAEPWKKRELLPVPRRAELVLCALAVLVSAFGLSFFADERIAYILLLPLLVFTVWGVRAPGAVTVTLLAALLCSVLFASLGGATLLLSLVTGISCLAYLFCVTARPYAAALPLAAAVGVFLLTNDLFMTAMAVSFLPAAILLSVATVTHQRRTTAICFCIGGILLSLLIGIAVFLYQTLGTLELEAVKQYFESVRAALSAQLLSVRDAFIETLRESAKAGTATAEQVAQTVASMEEALSAAVIEELVALFFSILPALAVIAASVVAFLSQQALSLTFYRTGMKEVLTLRASVFSMSGTASVIYVVGFFLSMFINTGEVVGAAVQNITLMLLPGFCVMGWGALRASWRNSKGGRRILLVVPVVMLACCAGLSSLYFLALWGAYVTLMTMLHLKMLQKLSQSGGSHSSHDGDDGEDD